MCPASLGTGRNPVPREPVMPEIPTWWGQGQARNARSGQVTMRQRRFLLLGLGVGRGHPAPLPRGEAVRRPEATAEVGRVGEPQERAISATGRR